MAKYASELAMEDAVVEACRVNLTVWEQYLEGIARYGDREWSPNIIKRLEEATGLSILAPGFPPEMVDDEPEESGYEVVPKGRS